jgi:membrane protease YdiL (CAAX protease family)
VDRTLPADRRRPARHPGVRWGLGDFFSVYLTGIVASFVLAAVGYSLSGDKSGRRKGRGTLRADFGLVVHPRDLWAIPAGIGLEIALALMVFPISDLVQNQRQGVVNDLETAHGLHLAVLALFAGLIAPVCEELLFRGLLLRGLRRRFSPVVAVTLSALVFALAHPALDPTWGTFVIVPALFGMGAVSGAIAVRRGDLSVSILLHIGFNFLTTFGAVVDSLHHH